MILKSVKEIAHPVGSVFKEGVFERLNPLLRFLGIDVKRLLSSDRV